LAGAWKEAAAEHCQNALVTWVNVWCSILLVGGILVAPFFFCPSKGTAIYTGILNILIAFVHVGLLIWGSVFFWSTPTECKNDVAPLYKMMLALLILGYLGLLGLGNNIKNALKLIADSSS